MSLTTEDYAHKCKLNMVYATRFNPELMPYVPVWNLRRAFPTASLHEQDRYILAGLKLGIWFLVKYPEKKVLLYCAKGTGYLHCGDEFLAVEMRNPRVIWKDGTFETKTKEQQAWANEYSELGMELDGVVI